MSLAPYTITALARNDIADTPTNRNVVVGAVVTAKDINDDAATMYDTAAGDNGSTSKATGIDGTVTVYVAPGEYTFTVNGRNHKAVVADSALRGDLSIGALDIRAKQGTVALPGFSFADDTDTGIYRSAENQLSLAAGGVKSLTAHPNGRITVGDTSPAAMITGLLTDNLGSVFRGRADWVGTTAAPYQNNDVMFLETYNNIVSDSENKSWAVSASNAYNNIPAGVVDTGTRIGVYGWAVSVKAPGYTHAGELTYQAGLMGRAGFFGLAAENQSPPGAVIRNAIGVTGQVISNSPGTTIVTAKAVEALSTGYQASTVEQNYGVYSQADGGSARNYSFWGESGQLFNRDKSFFGTSDTLPFSESSAKAVSRVPSNSFEFGFPSAGGYGSNLGCTPQSGFPFLAFAAESDAGNTFRTRGFAGHVIYDNLVGGLVFGSLADQSAAGQSVATAFTIGQGADVTFARRPILPSAPPDNAGAAGIAGQFAWDANYIYMCIATNTWKRVAIATW